MKAGMISEGYQSTHRFFGYGSLVNRATHDFHEAQVAQLRGWRRVWQRTTLREVAFLSVEPAVGAEIDGLVARVPGGDWAALDERERAYVKHAVETSVGAVQVYAVPSEHLSPAEDIVILLSYLDVVVQGFMSEFGEAGVARFFETTGGWAGRILDDRGAPIYSRHQSLSAEETALVDRWVARVM